MRDGKPAAPAGGRAWHGRAGTAAGAAGAGLSFGSDLGWVQLAGVFLITLGIHLWVMSRQQD
ncbi:hypothetical protein ACKI2N_030960 [Cupriavidus sp. 30B13]|uniref:hypothetical protein n=1 Tax=Cupriavidus sp. 30B13 TaxID=3384241 RepID=UPI003B90D9EE